MNPTKILFWFMSSMFIMVVGLLGIAFLTLLERKVLSYSQTRVGPNKTSIVGFIQPVLDGVKLLNKQILIMWKVQWLGFVLNPLIMFCIFIMIWCWLIPWKSSLMMSKLSIIILFFVLGIGAYTIILSGWASSSAFSKLGSMRGMLQNLSFEILLAVMYLSSFTMIFNSLSLSTESELSIMNMFMWSLIWLFLALLESNRAPFDFSEGESELISGFNIEMGSISFIMLFLSEYGSIIIMSVLMLLGISSSTSVLYVLFITLLILFRSCFPRLRYDIMMAFTWMILLPNLLFYMILTILLR